MDYLLHHIHTHTSRYYLLVSSCAPYILSSPYFTRPLCTWPLPNLLVSYYCDVNYPHHRQFELFCAHHLLLGLQKKKKRHLWFLSSILALFRMVECIPKYRQTRVEWKRETVGGDPVAPCTTTTLYGSVSVNCRKNKRGGVSGEYTYVYIHITRQGLKLGVNKQHTYIRVVTFPLSLIYPSCTNSPFQLEKL